MTRRFLKNLPPPYADEQNGARQHIIPIRPQDSSKIIQDISKGLDGADIQDIRKQLDKMEARLHRLEILKARAATLALQYQMLTI
jgi:hypothetical protein